MQKCFFKIIVPNYNNLKWLDRCLLSIMQQSFVDWQCVVVDDDSDEFGVTPILEIAQAKDRRFTIIKSDKKLWNGGARNVGIRFGIPSEYTVFVDSDDCLKDKDALKDLYNFIVKNNSPDCIRIQYEMEYDGNKLSQIRLEDNNPKDLVHSIFVACWTKVIKSELVQLFPENTLMEDVVQHIKQCDKIESVALFPRIFYHHNRNNENSCSIEQNQNLQNGKWQSSMFRYMADLLDLEVEHDYCEEERIKRKIACYENIMKGKYWQ